MTLTEIFGISGQIITNHFVESQQNVQIPTMTKNPGKVIDQQQEQIKKQAEMYWDTMYPKVKVEKEEDEDPFEELEEREHQLSRL